MSPATLLLSLIDCELTVLVGLGKLLGFSMGIVHGRSCFPGYVLGVKSRRNFYIYKNRISDIC